VRKDLLDTIRAVHAGEKHISPEVARQLADHVADDTLTARQIEVPPIDFRRGCKQTDR